MGYRKPRKVALPRIGNVNDPDGFYRWAQRYLDHLRVKNYSDQTVENRAFSLGFFMTWCEARGLYGPRDVTKPIVDGYQKAIFYLRQKNGKPLSFRTQHARLVGVRMFFKWLMRQNVLLSNPASELELPRIEHRLPRFVLSEEEADAVLAQADLSDPLGIRDRALMELVYSTGLRRKELLGLSVYGLDIERRTLMVRQGKGKKDRVVPVGERALLWLEKYLAEVRPSLVMPPDEGFLFLTTFGEEFTPHGLSAVVRRYVDAADIGKRGSCHLFRHTMATLMLENGADTRYIQAMLGHARLETTQIYTQVSIRKLQEVHAATHPTGRLKPLTAEVRSVEEQPEAASAEELLADLHAENDEERHGAIDGADALLARPSRSARRRA